MSGRASRRLAMAHDFRYVRGDMRWIALTTSVSVAVLLVLWAAIRL